MLLASELDSHLSECGFRIVKCVYCDKDMVAKNLEVCRRGGGGGRCNSQPISSLNVVAEMSLL